LFLDSKVENKINLDKRVGGWGGGGGRGLYSNYLKKNVFGKKLSLCHKL